MKERVIILLLAVLSAQLSPSTCSGTVFSAQYSVLSSQYHGKPFFRNFTALEYKGHNRNFALECDTTGRVYVANFEGLLVYDGAQWSMLHSPGISRITSIYKDKHRRVWFGGYNVLGYVASADSLKAEFVIDDTKVQHYGEITRIFDSEDATCFQTADGSVYCTSQEGKVSDEGAVAAQQKTTWKGFEINVREAIPDQHYTALATTSNGVFVIDEEENIVFNLTTDDGLCSNSITDLAYDGKGSLWGATDNGLFVISISPIFSHYTEVNGLKGQVTSIIRNPLGLYVGTLQGMYALRGDDRFERVSDNEAACWQVISPAEDYILAARANGVYIATLKEGRKLINPAHTLSLYSLDREHFLAGQLDGIYYCSLHGGQTLLDRVPNVSKFVADREGGIWAINLYNETYHLTVDSAQFSVLSCHFVKEANRNLTLLFEYTDPQGRLWHANSNNMGLTCVELNGNQRRWLLPFDAYNIQAMTVMGDDAWVGGNFGLIHFNLNEMAHEKIFTPKLFIRKWEHEGQNLHVVLATDKRDPIGRCRYSYRLHEDDAWSDWDEEHTYDFNHLGAGTYEVAFRVQDSYGNIDETAVQEFSVPVPLYYRWYMLLLYLVIILGITYAVFAWRFYNEKKRKQELEGKLDERTREVTEMQEKLARKDREEAMGNLTQGLIDRIQNPMNYFNNFAHLSLGHIRDLKLNIEDEEAKMTPDNYEDSLDLLGMLQENLTKIEQHGIATSNTLRAMETILKERQQGLGKVEPTNLISLCQQAVEMIQKYAEKDITAHGIKIETHFPPYPTVADISAASMTKALMAVLLNSIYALRKRCEKGEAGYQPLLRLTIIPKDAETSPNIIIYDNGVGIEEKNLAKIFAPFFTTKPTAEAPGVGLYFVQQVVQDVGGAVSVRSVQDDFTEFTISLR